MEDAGYGEYLTDIHDYIADEGEFEGEELECFRDMLFAAWVGPSLIWITLIILTEIIRNTLRPTPNALGSYGYTDQSSGYEMAISY